MEKSIKHIIIKIWMQQLANRVHIDVAHCMTADIFGNVGETIIACYFLMDVIFSLLT